MESPTADAPPPLIIDKADSIDTVINAMRLFPNEVSVQEQALENIQFKCGLSSKEQTLASFPSSTILFGYSLTDDPRSKIINAGAVPIIIATLQNHPSLQEKGRKVLQDLLVQEGDGVKKVLETLDKYPAQAFLREYCCQVLGRLMEGDEKYQPRNEFRECNGINSFLGILNNPETPAGLQIAALQTLRLVSRNATNCARMRDAVPLLLENLGQDKVGNEGHEAIVHILGNMALTSRKSRIAIGEHDGIPILLRLLERVSQTSSPNLKDTSMTLARVCSEVETNCQLFAQCEGIGTIVKLLGEQPPYSLSTILHVIATDEGLALQFADAGGVETLLAASRHGSASRPDQLAVFNVLCHYAGRPVLKERIPLQESIEQAKTALKSFPDLDSARDFLVSVGEENPAAARTSSTSLTASSGTSAASYIAFWHGTSEILESMRVHESNRELQEQACAALLARHIFSIQPPNIVDNGGVELVISAMEAHKVSEDIQAYACGVLSYVARSKSGAERIVDANGIIYALEAMHAHPNAVTLHQYANSLLSELLVREDNAKHLITSNNGIQIIVQSMQAHSSVAALQVNACKSLALLSETIRSNQAVIADAGGITAALSALSLHFSREAVREAACSALASLAFENSDNQTAMINQGGIRLLVQTIRLAGKSQKAAICCLSNLGHSGWTVDTQSSMEALKLFSDVVSADWLGAELQSRVCATMTDYMTQYEDAGQHLAAIHATKNILGAMKRHGTRLEFQEHCVRALLPLVSVPNGWRQAWKYNADLVVASALEQHADAEEFHELAFALLMRLADAKIAMRASPTLDLAQTARSNFPTLTVVADFLAGFANEQDGQNI